MKSQCITIKKSVCLSAASSRIFSNVLIFQVFWKTGLAVLVLLRQCQKYDRNLLFFCLDTKWTKKSRPVQHPPWKQTFLAESPKLAALKQSDFLTRKQGLLPSYGPAAAVRVENERKQGIGYETKMFIGCPWILVLTGHSGRRRSAGWKVSALRLKNPFVWA